MSHTEPTDHDVPSLDHLSADERSRLYEAARRRDDIGRLQELSVAALRDVAREEGLDVPPGCSRSALLFELVKHRLADTGLGWGEGVLDVLAEGYGFLRSPRRDFEPGADDVYVSTTQVRRLDLKPGQEIAGPVRPPHRGENFLALLHVELVDGSPVDEMRARLPFDQRTPLLPRRRLHLEHPGAGPAPRLVDLLAPWGLGQRVLIHAPPGAGRTLLLTQLAQAIAAREPGVHLLLALLDERPEEIAEVRRQVGHGRGREVVATAFDAPPARHLALAEMALARAQRLVEAGRDVVLALDSLTAFARACNQELPHSGKMLSVGLDAAALLRPKKLFAAARSLEEGGSLTVLATVLTATGSRLDEVIAEEFAGKANSEVVLDPGLASLHVEPALDVLRTGTRREDCLLDAGALAALRRLRLELAPRPPRERLEALLQLLARHPTNAGLLAAPDAAAS
jgi:transcription termination factor Rho